MVMSTWKADAVAAVPYSLDLHYLYQFITIFKGNFNLSISMYCFTLSR